MRRQRLSKEILLAGILSIAIAGCGNSGGEGTSTGGTTGSPQGSGGTASGSDTGGVVGSGGIASSGGVAPSGGTTSSGGVASGGTTARGGSTGQIVTGGTTGNGGTTASGGKGSGGVQATGGAGTGGQSTPASGGVATSGGTVSTGGGNTGGLAGGGARTGGSTVVGGRATGGAAGGGTGTGGTTGSGGASAGSTGNPGTCTASKAAGVTVSGSGPHKVTVESNSDSEISCGTIYRPTDLGGTEKYPIFVWGEGGCARSGTSNQASMGEIASHGYFVVADGPTGSAGNCGTISMSTDVVGMGKVMVGYIDWAIAENGKSCSAYYQSLDTTKIASDGFSCGGLMSYGTAADSRMTAVGISSSGMTSAVASFYKSIHTPIKILLGGSGDIAYTNGERDYDQISALGIPIILLSKAGAGHGGDLSNGKGDFNSVNLAWLNWQLKSDETATGKGALVGSSCKYCTDSTWEVKSKNLP